jgi:hypothetical protein
MRTGWNVSLVVFKQRRRLVTRYEKRAANYRAMWTIAAAIHWLRFADTPWCADLVLLSARARR